MFTWRDTGNPEGGGAELYLERVARGLVERGARVTLFTAAYPGAAGREVRDGIRYVRRGEKVSVYLWGMLLLLTGRLGRPDVVVDVQNGVPFWTRLVTRRPVVVLVHHVHREQWPVVYPGRAGKVGWWLESRLATRVYRRSQYVAVSGATREEIVRHGVDRERIAVVHNGADLGLPPTSAKTEHPSVCTVSRLVPHKQIEHAIDAVVALREEFPGLRLSVVGSGWWEDHLTAYAASVDAGESVEFLGHVDDALKHEVYARSWVQAVPSLKEGWGLVITEAGRSSTPSVAYRSAGGTTESIVDGESGLLADGPEEFVAHLGRVLRDEILRKELADGAYSHAAAHTWEQSQTNFAAVLGAVLSGERVAASD